MKNQANLQDFRRNFYRECKNTVAYTEIPSRPVAVAKISLKVEHI